MKTKCMFPACKMKKIHVRGVCVAHYDLMLTATQKSEQTWKNFEDAGYCLPPKKKGKRTELSDHFYRTIEEGTRTPKTRVKGQKQ